MLASESLDHGSDLIDEILWSNPGPSVGHQQIEGPLEELPEDDGQTGSCGHRDGYGDHQEDEDYCKDREKEVQYRSRHGPALSCERMPRGEL